MRRTILIAICVSVCLCRGASEARKITWHASGKGGAVAAGGEARRRDTRHHENSFDPNPDRTAAFVAPGGLRVEDTIDADVRKRLSGRGHRLSVTSGPIAHPVMIYIDQASGTIYAAGDPKARRHAAAID